MIKVVYCITKKLGLTDEEFFDYWKNVHGPLAAEIPGLRRLVQSHAVRRAGESPAAATYDGVAELWFDDLEALAAARATEAWRALTADEANFVDDAEVAYLVTREHEIPLTEE